MTDQGLLGTFASHAFLRALSNRHLMLLATGVRPFTAAAGDHLALEGQLARAFYLVQSGRVALGLHTPDRGIVTVQTVGPGEVVGWSWLLPPYRWQFDATALDAVQGLQLDGEWLREKCEQDHDLGYSLLHQLMTVVAGRLTATRKRLLDEGPGPV